MKCFVCVGLACCLTAFFVVVGCICLAGEGKHCQVHLRSETAG